MIIIISYLKPYADCVRKQMIIIKYKKLLETICLCVNH